MKNGTNDQIQGALPEAKGKIKEKTGKIFDNPNLETEGQDEKLAGKLQKKRGHAETVLEK